MGVPPTNLPPSSSGGSQESSSGKVQDRKPKKNFQLPSKADQEGGGKGKDVLPDAIQEPAAVKGQLEEGQLAAETTAQSEVTQTASASAAAAVGKIGELIGQMVSQLAVGTVDGKTFASLDLTTDVPEYLANTTLTLTQSENGLVVNITNFESLGQQQTAILNIQQQQEQLQQLVNNLQVKNIQLVDFQIGGHSINLPTAETVTPIEAPPIAPEAQREEGQRGGDEGGGDTGGGPKGGPE